MVRCFLSQLLMKGGLAPGGPGRVSHAILSLAFIYMYFGLLVSRRYVILHYSSCHSSCPVAYQTCVYLLWTIGKFPRPLPPYNFPLLLAMSPSPNYSTHTCPILHSFDQPNSPNNQLTHFLLCPYRHKHPSNAKQTPVTPNKNPRNAANRPRPRRRNRNLNHQYLKFGSVSPPTYSYLLGSASSWRQRSRRVECEQASVKSMLTRSDLDSGPSFPDMRRSHL